MESHHGIGSTDSMLLSWGSSVNVCEDSRRAIRQEIDQIDNSIANLHGKVKSEERASSQVLKDLSHARAEMSNYRRGAADVLDNASMNDQLRARLMEALKSDLLNPLRKPSANSNTISSISETNGDSDLMNQPPTHVMSFVEQRDADVVEMVQLAMKKKAEVQAIKSKKLALVEDMNRINRIIAQNDLVSGSAMSSMEMSNQENVLDENKHQKRTIKIAVHEARTKCGIHAQDIADRTKALIAKKFKSSQDELVLADELAKAVSDDRESDERIAALQSECEFSSQQVEALLKSIADFDCLNETRSTKRRQLSKLLAELTDASKLFETQHMCAGKEAEFALITANELQAANISKVEVQAMRDENDQMEIEHQALRLEHAELTKAKENLAANMTALDQNSRPPMLSLEKELQESEEFFVSLVDAAKKDAIILDEKRTMLEHFRLISKESSEAATKELAELNKIVTSLKEAETAEMERFCQLKMELKTSRQIAIHDKQTTSILFREASIQKHEILICGLAMLDGALAAEQSLEAIE